MASIDVARSYLNDAIEKLTLLESQIVNVATIDNNASTMDAMKKKVEDTKKSLEEIELQLRGHKTVIDTARTKLGL